MSDATYAHLTPVQLMLLQELTVGPVRMTSEEMVSTERGKAGTYLMNAGLANARPVHIKQRNEDTIIEITRSQKPHA